MKKTKLQVVKQDQKPKIAFWISIAVLTLVVLGMIAVFTNTHYNGDAYLKSKARLLKSVFPVISVDLLAYYSFCINIVAAIVATMNIVEFALVQKRKLVKVDNWLHTVNLATAAGLVFNWIFTHVYLLPITLTISDYYFLFLITGSNLFFVVIVPVLFTFMYLFCFKGYSLNKWWQSLIGVAPILIYFAIYMIVCLSHVENGIVDQYYDIYYLGAKHYYLVIVAFFVAILAGAGISIGLWKTNTFAKINRWMLIFVINVFLLVAVLFCTGFMLHTNITDDRFIEGLTVTQSVLSRFMLFTHLSNWFVGVSSTIYIVYSWKMYKHHIKSIPIWAQIVRLASVTCILITLGMQLIICSSQMINATDWNIALAKGYDKCFRKHLILEHFLIPMVAMASWMIVEHSDLKWKHLLFSSIPLAFYVLIYVIVLYCHLDEPLRKDLPQSDPRAIGPITLWDVYDLSGVFGKAGRYIYWLMPFLGYGIMLCINWVFWLVNRKLHFDQPKKGPVWAELRSDIANWKASRK